MLNVELPQAPAIPLLGTNPGGLRTCAHSNLYVRIYSAIIHNSQEVGTTQMPTNWWLSEEKVVFPYNGILFGNKKEWSTDIWYYIDEPQNIKEKPVMKDHILCDLIDVNCPK